MAESGAGGADQRCDGGHQDLPERRRGPQRGQDHTGCEAAEKAIQLGERMEERAVSEQAAHRLVDVAQPESEEEPGEHACPGEEGAEGKKQTIGLSSDQAGGDQLGKTRWKNSARPATPSLA